MKGRTDHNGDPVSAMRSTVSGQFAGIKKKIRLGKSYPSAAFGVPQGEIVTIFGVADYPKIAENSRK